MSLKHKLRNFLPLIITIMSFIMIGGILLFLPDSIRSWIAGGLAAILTGYLVNVLPDWIRRLNPSKSQGSGNPILVTAKIIDVDYMLTHEPNGRIAHVPASGHIVRLSIEAADSRTTIIQDICPVVVSRKREIGELSPHLGIVTPRAFEVLLDDMPPRLRAVNSRIAHFPYKVSPNDPEVFDLKVLTAYGDVRWVLDICWMCLGKEGTNRVDLGGRPFRTMARTLGVVSE